jgi:hypothetical protein
LNIFFKNSICIQYHKPVTYSIKVKEREKRIERGLEVESRGEEERRER